MAKRIKVLKLWEYGHCRPLDSLSVAGESGDTFVCDRRDRLILIDPTGKIKWDWRANFAPVEGRITAAGDGLFVFTYEGRLLRITPEQKIEWELWIDREGKTLAVKSSGQAAIVASHKGRFHVINASGKNTEIHSEHKRRISSLIYEILRCFVPQNDKVTTSWGISGKNVRIFHTPEPVAHARFAARTGQLVLGSAMGWVGIYDNWLKLRSEFRLNCPVLEVEVSGRGDQIYLSTGEEGFNVIDLKDNHMTTFHPGFAVSNIGVNENGEKIVAVGLEGQMALLDSSGAILWSEKTEHSWILCEMTLKGDRFTVVSGKGLVACYGVSEGYVKEKKTLGHSDFDFLEV